PPSRTLRATRVRESSRRATRRMPSALDRRGASRCPPPRRRSRAPGPSCRQRRSGREDLVENRRGLLLIGLLGERQLGDQDLAGLREHPLLAGREAAILVATPQVAHDFGDLDDVTGGELLEVRLVAAAPV